ncbi:ABC transporter permease subunit/CPBP intramembrane protease [Anatilimnocola floriformis]|uniref:ABC transporter permease subunit/CPBP intramembrane protease n=1 Tax=Anatilimnocola floriformis TaxID=2948575 RepID=UPI0020C45F7D|nr:ABC transporter permease subunit/CPBP intramembrane protease [Anatilimnocola floriformis]
MPDSPPEKSTTNFGPRQSWVTRVVRLTRKELRETLRDRRTIVTLILMPLMLYPLISIVFMQFMFLNAGQAGPKEMQWNIAVRRAQDFDRLMEALQIGEAWMRKRGELAAATPPADSESGTAVASPSLTQAAIREPKLKELAGQFDDNINNLHQMLRGPESYVDAVVLVTEPTEGEGSRANFEVMFRPASAYGRELSRFIERRLRAANEALLYADLKERGGSDLPRVTAKLKAVETTDETIQIATLIPLILILMTMTGAVYPAIDLTAGERERGTLEALMAAPVPRLGLLIAKYLAVLCVALMTAVVNLTAMTITLQASKLGQVLLGPQGLPLSTVFAVFGLLLLFAAFFSAVMLTITSFARSFKEAQAYLIPLVLLSLAPGFLSLLPGLKLDGFLAITPLANIVLLSRDLLQSKADPIAAATAVITTALYALAALALAAKIFGSDAVLYGSEGSWTELVRRPADSEPTPTLAQGATAVAILYPCYFLVSGFIGNLQESSLQTQLLAAAAGTAAVFLLVPLLLTYWTNRQFRPTLQLRVPSPLAILGGLLLGLSLWPFAHELIVISQQIGLSTLSPEQLAELVSRFAERSDQMMHVPFGVILLSMAVAPAVCEELFFRGYFQTALLNKLPWWGAILISAAVFGVFHISVGGLVILERVLSSAMLGLLLGWVCYRTGSVWPGMILHVIHNGLVVSLARYKDEIQQLTLVKQLGWNPENATHLPAGLLILAAITAGAGLTFLAISSRRRSQ